MQKQMQYAVKSFATRALDEWVLDYPQQVVVTTLNLVLTNEVNDILEERQREKELAEAEEAGSELEGQEEGDGEEAGEEEQDAKDEAAGDDKSKNAGDSQRDPEKKDGVDEGQAAPSKKTLKGTATLKRSPGEERARLLGDLFGMDFRAEGDPRFEKAVEVAKEEVRLRRIAQAQAGASSAAAAAAAAKAAKRAAKRPVFRDYVMEVLGQQTFYGVYLRIQFWINKLIRALTDERRSDW
jgi:hypothetical protein